MEENSVFCVYVTTFYVGGKEPVHYEFFMHIVQGKYADLKEMY
jgi:hypothetical protein